MAGAQPRAVHRLLTMSAQDRKTAAALVLQLRIISLVVTECGGGLVTTSPQRPSEDEGLSSGRPDKKASQEIADFGHARHEGGHADQAAIGLGGLLSFGLPQALRRRSADSLERKARAAMHRLMCRCQPCHERASQ